MPTSRPTARRAGQINDGRVAALRDLETNLEQNGYWLSRITQSYARGEDVAAAFDPRPFYDRLTPAAVRDAAVRYLDETRYVQVILRPEK